MGNFLARTKRVVEMLIGVSAGIIVLEIAGFNIDQILGVFDTWLIVVLLAWIAITILKALF